LKSLIFIILRSLKNSFLEILRKPAKLALYLFLVIFIVLIALSALLTKGIENHADLVWLKGIIFIFIMLFVVLYVKQGLSTGSAIFDMNDVNLLFVSPVNPKAILIYGIARIAKTAILAGFFILFQSSSLGMNFGINFAGILFIFIWYIFTISVIQILSLLIYSVTNSRPKRKTAVRIISITTFIPLAFYSAVQLLSSNGDWLKAVENILRSPLLSWIPAAGWMAQGTVSFFEGDLFICALFLGVTLAAGAAMILFISLSNPDFYEDVLVASEMAFDKKRAAAEGRARSFEALSSKKIRVGGTGIGGYGAAAIFYKHLRESFRANRLGLWGISSFLIVAATAVVSFFLGQDGIVIILQTLMWMQIFLIGTGRGLRELYSHYIFVIPAGAFSKMIWSNMELVFKVFVESVFIFGIAGIIIKENPLLIAALILTYTLFSPLLLGINYVSLRWMGANISAGILILIYTLAVIIVMLPGLIPALIAGFMIADHGIYAALGILSVWELLAAAACFALARGIIHSCDMPVVKLGS
jgi:hypothetical protein